MASKFIKMKEAAKMLGVTPDDLNEMRSRGEIFGYRDGSAWKFKPEEIDRVAGEQGISLAAETVSGEEGGSTIDADLEELFDVSSLEGEESSQADEGITKLGTSEEDKSATDSDIQIGDELRGDSPSGFSSDLHLADSSSTALPLGEAVGDDDWGLDEASEDLSLGSSADLSLEELGLEGGSSSGSSVNLDLEDEDDLVLGSGIGSDVTLDASESGISLESPSDSGLSLEDSNVESLELGEDDVISMTEGGDNPEAETQLHSDDDFLLEPTTAAAAEESSMGDSSSQVILLDEDEFDEAATAMLDSGSTPNLVEEHDPGQTRDLGEAVPMGGASALTGGSARVMQPEASYSIWNVMSLAIIVLFLIFSGMMMVDLVRQMWSWNQPFAINSWFMDTVLGMFGN